MIVNIFQKGHGLGYSKEHTARVKADIVDAAGRAFRTKGYRGVGIDQIMSDAGLTRGGFYLHFKSKEALYAAVVAAPFDFTNQIGRLAEMAPGRIEDRVFFAIEHYLDPDQRRKIGDACTMVALGAETARASIAAKTAFADGFEALLDTLVELARADGHKVSRETFRAVIAQAVGALTMARAMPDANGALVLRDARSQIADMIRA